MTLRARGEGPRTAAWTVRYLSLQSLPGEIQVHEGELGAYFAASAEEALDAAEADVAAASPRDRRWFERDGCECEWCCTCGCACGCAACEACDASADCECVCECGRHRDASGEPVELPRVDLSCFGAGALAGERPGVAAGSRHELRCMRGGDGMPVRPGRSVTLLPLAAPARLPLSTPPGPGETGVTEELGSPGSGAALVRWERSGDLWCPVADLAVTRSRRARA